MSELEFNVPFQHKHGYIRGDVGIRNEKLVSLYVVVNSFCRRVWHIGLQDGVRTVPLDNNFTKCSPVLDILLYHQTEQ